LLIEKALKPLSIFKSIFYSLAILSFVANVQAQQNPEIGTAAKEFQLNDLTGKQHQLNKMRGKVVIINFWATWCIPCRTEMPSMNRAWKALSDKDVVMLAINFGESKKAVSDFVKAVPIDFPVLLDETNTVSSDWNVTGMPTTMVIDQQGNIVDRIVGPKEWDSPQILKAIEELSSKK
jgi:peroxiredoxin